MSANQGITGAVKQAFTAATQNAKLADLQRNKIDPGNHGGQYSHTTDHGVPVHDTDNW